MKDQVLVICVGNPLRGDDGAGSEVARLLREARLVGATILERSGEALDLIETWRGAGRVVLVDAVQSLGKPGSVHKFDLTGHPLSPHLSDRHARRSTHSLGVAEAIELARALNAMPERLLVYGIEGSSFETGAPLSPEARKATIEVADCVIKEVESLRGLDERNEQEGA